MKRYRVHMYLYAYNIKNRREKKKKTRNKYNTFLFLQDIYMIIQYIYMIIQYIYICNIAYLHLKKTISNRALARFGEIPFIFQVQKRCQFKFVGILQATSYKAESMMPHCVFFLGINQYYNMRV